MWIGIRIHMPPAESPESSVSAPRPHSGEDVRAKTWRWRPYILASIAAAVIGGALSSYAWLAISHQEERLAAMEFKDRANNTAFILQTGIDEYIGKIVGLRAMFQSLGDKVTRDEFDGFTKYLLRGQTAMLGATWAPRIPQSQRAAHEQAAARGGLTGYRIHWDTPDGRSRPAPMRSEYFPLFYTSNEKPTSPVYGFDLNDDGARQRALKRARDNDRFATSANVILKGGIGDRTGFIVTLPIYKPGLPHDSVQERRNNLAGFVQGAFQISLLIDTVLAKTKADRKLNFFLFDAEAGNAALPFYFDAPDILAAPLAARRRAALVSGLYWSQTINVGDRKWAYVATPMPGGVGTPNHVGSWGLLAAGLFTTAAAVAYILASGRQSIGALKSANELLRTQNLRFDAALNNMLQGLLMFDSKERVAVCNDRYIEMYHLSREIVKPGCSLRELLQHRLDTGLLTRDPEQYRAELLSGIRPEKGSNWIMPTADGREIAVVHNPIADGGWIVTHEDITARRKAEAKIEHLTLYDALTNLPNRLSFHRDLERRLAHRGRDEKFAILYLDLDNFKNVNDTVGHAFGDDLLCQAAERLRNCVRECDGLARFGGDEFVILQTQLAQPTDTVALAERLIEVIGAPFDLAGQHFEIGVSIGITIAPGDAADADLLLKNADLALYRAKSDDRGSYRFFEPEMDAHMQARRALEIDLRKAIEREEFEVYYQPLVDLKTEQISGFEALIRWNHPERGLVSPIDFVPFAEETGLIVPIGEWVLRQACKEAARWPDDIGVAVNLSPAQFKTSTLFLVVSSALARSGFAANRLQLEITESILLTNSESTLAMLRQLRDLGVRIAMDDFGTGYSSLSYLQRFPFDKIKIDQSFVRDLSANPDSMAIVRAISALGKSLGMSTTGEGIETRADLDLLKREGCTEGQGYFFSKPRPAKDVHALLAARKANPGAVA